MPRFAEPVIALMMTLCTTIALVAGCSYRSQQPLLGGNLSMYVSAVRAGDERIAVSCSFANTGDRPLLVGENIDIGYYIRTPDSFESDAVEASQMAAPNHYVLLPVVPLNRRGGKTFMDGEFISRQVMIHARNEMDRMAGTLEVVADLELLQYDTKTKRLESRRETITQITELPRKP